MVLRSSSKNAGKFILDTDADEHAKGGLLLRVGAEGHVHVFAQEIKNYPNGKETIATPVNAGFGDLRGKILTI